VDPSSVAECKERWDTAGWCVITDVIPADLLAEAQRALPSVFPTADEFADGVDPERNAAFMTERHSPHPTFPFEAEALNRVALHDNVIDLAERMLESADIRLYQGAVSAKYANAAPDYEQLLHADYGNHTLVVPRTDAGYQHVTMFVYLSDVTPETAATRVVSREHTAGIPVERLYLHLDDYKDVYAAEEPAVGPAGSVFVYRPDVFHRGMALEQPRGARFNLNVAFKPAAAEWVGFHTFPVHAEDMAWHRFMRHATVRQLTVLGFPAPGDPYWTRETLAGVSARYPALDMSPWRNGSNP
jgi:ectoine hydroxylase-related dioxygenase (phytanoyl-CoA dioxygenase family)